MINRSKINIFLTGSMVTIVVISFLVFNFLNTKKVSAAATEEISRIRQDCSAYTLGVDCFTSLASWESAKQQNLVTADKIAVAQIEGTWTNPDTTAVVIDGWTTDATHYIKIYTTAEARHSGVWNSTTKYRLVSNKHYNAVLEIPEEFVRVDGLQIEQTTAYDDGGSGVNAGAAGCGIQLSNNIIRFTGGAGQGGGVPGISLSYATNASYKVWNNIIYDFKTGINGASIRSGSVYTIYNNTIFNSGTYGYGGVRLTEGASGGTVNLKNNIVQGSGTNYALGDLYGGTTKNYATNISQDSSSPTSAMRSLSVIFENFSNKDFRLSLSDTNAREKGTDLSSDSALSFSADIAGTSRVYSGNIWDIGAYEVPEGSAPAPTPDTIPPVLSAGSPSGSQPAGTTSVNLSVTTDETATCKYSTTAGTDYSAPTGNIAMTAGANNIHTATISGLTYGINYNYYVRCQDSSNNANTSDYAISFSITAPADATPPTVPTGLTASVVSQTQINLSWTASTDPESGVSGYKIYRNGVSTPIADVSGTSYQNTGLTQGTAYSYTVSAYNFAGGESAKSSAVSATTLAQGQVAMGVWVIGDSAKVKPDGSLVNNEYMAENPNYKTSNYFWDGNNNQIKLKSGKNEYTGYQIIVNSTGGNLSNVNLTFSDLKDSSNNTIPVNRIDSETKDRDQVARNNNISVWYFKELYVNIPQASYRPNSKGPGDFPDPLVPSYAPVDGAPYSVTEGKNLPIWVDVYVPHGTTPGVYTGTVTISSTGQTPKVLNLQLIVWNIDIPDKPSLKFWWHFYQNDLGKVNGIGDGWVFDPTVIWPLEKYYAIMTHEHRAIFSPRDVNVPTEYDINGNFAYPPQWSKFDTTFGTILDGSLYDDGIGEPIWQIGGYGGLKADAGLAEGQMISYSTAALNKIKNSLSAFVTHLESMGWGNKTLFTYFWDEPTLKVYDSVDYISRIVNQATNGKAKFMVTEQPLSLDAFQQSTKEDYEKSHGPSLFERSEALEGEINSYYTNWVGKADTKTDFYIPNAKHYIQSDPYLTETAEYARSHGTGVEVWTYQDSEPYIGNQIIDADGLSFRMWPWAAWKYKTDGLFFWCVNQWAAGSAPKYSNPAGIYTNLAITALDDYMPSPKFVFYGDGLLFYPGGPKGVNGPVSSHRMKQIRKGMTDYEYIKMLENLGDSQFALNEYTNTINFVKAYNSFVPATSLSAAAAANATSIQLADTSKILAFPGKDDTLKIIGDIPAHDEIVACTSLSGKICNLGSPLKYNHDSGSVVSPMYVAYSFQDELNADWDNGRGKWGRNIDDWDLAKENMAGQIAYLMGGGTPVDTTAPSAITNLSVASIGLTSANLSWTAPGDDGNTGTASLYMVKYSTSQITDSNWASVTDAVNEPAPLVAGTTQTMTVSGLLSNTKYYFAIKTSDESGNISLLSTGTISGTTLSPSGDTTDPSPVGDLSSTNLAQTSLTLTWTAPGDDENIGTANSYTVKYSTSPINAGNFDLAASISNPPTPSVAGSNQTFPISGLTANTLYYFALKTTDESGNTSSISNIYPITTLPLATDPYAPAKIENLGIDGLITLSGVECGTINGVYGCVGDYGLTLKWTAPGDDDNTGTASSYTLRYSTSTAITSANWNNSLIVNDISNEPTPALVGVSQTMPIYGLLPSTTYHFAIKAADEVGNLSPLSNVYSTTTPAFVTDTTAPTAITTLRSSAVGQTSVSITWTAPGDDADTGTSAYYDVRYSSSAITDSNWNSVTQAEGEPIPKIAGTIQGMTIVGLDPSTKYYFAIKATDEANNTSSLSNVVTNTTQPTDFTVSLGLSSISGITPFKTTLTAGVKWSSSCNASSLDYNYTFYCDRNDSGTDITSPYSKQIMNSKNSSETYECNYTSPGTYTAKVVVERGSFKTQNTRTVVVGSGTTPSVFVPGLTGGGDVNACISNDGTTPAPATTSGGGGGGGGYYDTTPPSKPDKFKAVGGVGKITLSWENPKDSDFVGVVVARSTTTNANMTINDGKKVYTGDLHEFIDSDIESGQTYYYSIFSRDSKPNYSQPVTITTKTTQAIPALLVGVEKVTTPVTVVTGAAQPLLSKLPTLVGPLSIGMKSDQVKLMQQILSSLNFLTSDGVTGLYGPITTEAVKKFQTEYKIVSSDSPHYGFAGPSTRKKMNEVYGAWYGGGRANVTTVTDSQQLEDARLAQVREQIKVLQEMLIKLLQRLMEEMAKEGRV